MNIVVFAGAGFSAPFGYPVMNNFFTEARTSDRLDQNQVTILDEIIGESNKANRIVNTSPTNLESVLSMAVMGERLGIGQDKSSEIIGIIGEIYRSVKDVSNYWSQFKHLEDTLGFNLNKHHEQIKFITTNYDLCIESALHRSNLSVDIPFDFIKPLPGNEQLLAEFHSYYPKKVPVYKLHGSVNWFKTLEDPNKIVVDNRIVKVGRTGSKNYLPIPLTQDYGTTRNLYLHKSPILIPPSFLKPDFNKIIKDIWSEAAKSLQNADILIFIGYSFPKSDTEMKFFFR